MKASTTKVQAGGRKSVIVYGPQGCGKTRRGEELRKLFMLDRIVELDERPSERQKADTTGTLYLTIMTPEEMKKKKIITDESRRVISFGEAMAPASKLAGGRTRKQGSTFVPSSTRRSTNSRSCSAARWWRRSCASRTARSVKAWRATARA